MRVRGPWRSRGGRGWSSRQSAVALSAPHSGVGGRAGGGRVLQAKLRGGACARASVSPMRAPLRAEGPAVSRLRCLGAEVVARRMGSGGRPRRRRRRAGAGPVAVAGRLGRPSWRSAEAPRAPHCGVGGRAGGERAVQAKLRGAHAQGCRLPSWGPLRAPGIAAGLKRCSGAEAGEERLGSGVHGHECPRRVRGGACGPAGGRWPH